MESKHGSASADINEMLEVKLPENVKVVIEAGGASEWQNRKIKEDVLTRFVYDQNAEPSLKEEQSSARSAESR